MTTTETEYILKYYGAEPLDYQNLQQNLTHAGVELPDPSDHEKVEKFFSDPLRCQNIATVLIKSTMQVIAPHPARDGRMGQVVEQIMFFRRFDPVYPIYSEEKGVDEA